jgi:hypothetical protein
MTPDATLTVRTPAELIAAVPYLIGFHPEDSLTVVAVRGRAVVFTARHDLPDPNLPDAIADADARHIATLVARNDADAATVIGHGTADRVTPAAMRLGDFLHRLGIEVLDVLRVADGRFWSYLCEDPDCCPPEGLPCAPADGLVAAAATYAGQVALPDRESVAAQLDPVTGAERQAMSAATRRASARLAGLVERAAAGPAPVGAAGPVADALVREVRRAGRTAVRGAFRRHRAGGRLGDDEVAWLAVLLEHLPVRDYAWERIGDDPWQVALWTDVVRRVEPEHVPPAACLLAFAAWRTGQGALAAVAVDRARSHDPEYSMARLLDDVLHYALAPEVIEGWPTPHRPRRGPRRRSRGRTTKRGFTR